MDTPERGALMLVRIIALALIGWAVAELVLYWAVCHRNHQPAEILKVVFKSLPLLAGVIMLVKARALAEWISELLDL
jgi:uncharacterized membrane protein HdeD (DUF308 family)